MQTDNCYLHKCNNRGNSKPNSREDENGGGGGLLFDVYVKLSVYTEQ